MTMMLLKMKRCVVFSFHIRKNLESSSIYNIRFLFCRITFHCIFQSDNKVGFWSFHMVWSSPKNNYFQSLNTSRYQELRILPLDPNGVHSFNANEFRIKVCVRYIFGSLFACLKKSSLETRKNVLYFTPRAFFVPEINLNCSDVQTLCRYQLPKHETWNILLNNLGIKHSLVMKFGQFM